MAGDMTTVRLAAFSVVLLTACASKQTVAPSMPEPSVPPPTLERVAPDVWMHTSWSRVEPWGLVLSHGLVVRGPEGVTLIDTAWSEEETAMLLSLIEKEVGAPVDTVIVTHAHGDKMGGMKTVNQRVRRSLALKLTNDDAPARGLVPAHETVGADETVGSVQVFYPGPGHTRDNIVVYHPASKVLFGGCLIRPGGSSNLGNTGDADVAQWANSVAAVRSRFPDAQIVIPSHGDAGGRELLDHTIDLGRSAQSAK